MKDWQEIIIAAHRDVTDAVSHREKLKSRRYFVWQEDGARDLSASDRHTEKAVTGTTDLYTHLEFDPWADALGEAFSNHGIAWSLNSIQYEPETRLTHYEWIWSI